MGGKTDQKQQKAAKSSVNQADAALALPAGPHINFFPLPDKTLVYDASGKPIKAFQPYCLAENAPEVFNSRDRDRRKRINSFRAFHSSGSPLYAFAAFNARGNYIAAFDDNGERIDEYVAYDADGKQVTAYDQKGQLIDVLDANNKLKDVYRKKSKVAPLTCTFDDSVHYLFDESKKDEQGSIAHFIHYAVRQGGEAASVSRIDFSKGADLDVIRIIINEAIGTALNDKNGNLYFEPIGLLDGNIDADAYAGMLIDEIFSLPAQSLSQLSITFPVNTNEKYNQVEARVRNKLMEYRVTLWAIESLALDASNTQTLNSVNLVVQTLLGSGWDKQLDKLFMRFKYFRNSLIKEGSNFKVKEYVERKEQLCEHLRSLMMPVLISNNGCVVGLVDDYSSVLKHAAICEESKTFKEDNFSEDGFVERVKNGIDIEETLQLVQADLIAAQYQLAINHPQQSNNILNILICTFDNIGERLRFVASEGIYPRHILLHSSGSQGAGGGHWTRISINESAKKGNKTHLVITHTNSYGQNDHAWLDDLVDKAYPANHFPKVITEVKAVGTYHQTDTWSCGYHAFTGAIRELGVPGVPNTDFRKHGELRTRTTQNWFFNLIFGQTYDAYLQGRNDVDLEEKESDLSSPKKPQKKQSSSGAASDQDDDSDVLKKQEPDSLASVKQKKQAYTALGKSRLDKSEFNRRKQSLTIQLLRFAQLMEELKGKALSLSDCARYEERLSGLKKCYRQIKSAATSASWLSVKDREVQLDAISTQLDELDKQFTGLKSNALISDDSDELSKVEDPLLKIQKLEAIKTLNKTLEQLTPIDMSSKGFKRYLALRDAVSAALQGQTKLQPAGRLCVPKGTRMTGKALAINQALRGIDSKVQKKLLGLEENCSDYMLNEASNELAEQYNEITQKISLNQALSCEEKIIVKRYQRLPKENGVDDQAWLDDPDRMRAILEAWDDPQSDFYKAVNMKRYSIFGMSLTFFSGKNWGDIINGDSQLVKEMKEEERKALTTFSAETRHTR